MSDGVRWTDEQLEAINERRREVILSAAAGSGKTAVLVERVLQAALGTASLSPVPVERMLVVTFTVAAANELKARLHGALLDERRRLMTSADAGRARRLELVRRQLAALPRAQISTIHSFCAQVIRSYGYQRGIDHGRQLDADEAALIRHELATEMLDSRLGPDNPEVRELALSWGGRDGIGPEDLSGGTYASGLREPLLKLHDFYTSLVDHQNWYEKHMALPELDPAGFGENDPVVRMLEQELRDWAAGLVERDRQITAYLEQRAPEAVYLKLISRRKAIFETLSLAAGWEAAQARLERLFAKQDDLTRKPKLVSTSNAGIDSDEVKKWLAARHKTVDRTAKKWREVFSSNWEQVARRENTVRRQIRTLWELMKQFAGSYKDYKRERELLDFDDLEQGAFELLALHGEQDELLRDGAGALLPSAAAREMRTRFELVMVDEYQDTNGLQDAIVNLVTPDAPSGPDGGGRPRFVVGDLKQSIYAFRGAQPQIFTGCRKRLKQAADKEGGVLVLSRNFRSRPLLIEAINHVFEGLMDERLGGEDYAKNRLAPGLDYGELFAARGAGHVGDCPARLHLVDPGPGGGADEDDGDSTKQELGYRRVAAVLAEIKQDQRPVYAKGDGVVRAASWRDMAVLLRTMAGCVESLTAQLDEAGVPYYAPARSGFYERPEIADALSLLRLADNAYQDIALAAVLRGPAVGLSPQELLAVARQDDDGDGLALWERLQHYLENGEDSGLRARLSAFVERYHEWRDAARFEPVPVFLWRLYRDTGLLAAAAGQKHGEQRLANLFRLHELAREFSGFERQGLARFLRYLEHSRRARGDLGDAPVLGEDQDVVRVMTVHQAKGLEFPVVVLPDLQRRFNLKDLEGDVLWHARAGIGGRFVDMLARPPMRADTLALRQAKAALRRDAVSEQLRLLYVAMTRARERLELVAVADEKARQEFAGEPAGEDARSWLDWIGTRLAGAVTTAAAAADGSAALEQGWEVKLRAPQVEEVRADLTVATGDEHETAKLSVLQRRLGYSSPYPGSGLMPLKATVTQLAKQPIQPDDGESVVVISREWDEADDAAPAARQPDRQQKSPSAAQIGTATHRLLASIDFSGQTDPASLAGLREKLVGRGMLEVGVAGLIDVDAMSRAVEDLRPYMAEGRTALYRELPFSMLVPAGDLALRDSPGAELPPDTVHPDDEIYIQGVIDLLAVSADGVMVLDYKTDRTADAEELVRRYENQLGWYCRAAAAMFPDAQVRWALYGLAGAGIVGPFEFSRP